MSKPASFTKPTLPFPKSQDRLRSAHRKGPKIIYPAAIVKESTRKDAARDFMSYVQSPAAKDAFKKYGLWCSIDTLNMADQALPSNANNLLPHRSIIILPPSLDTRVLIAPNS